MLRLKLRRVPPAHSPVPAGALPRAAARALGLGADATESLRARLARDYDAGRVVLCGSGTAALGLAIARALRETGSERVALPAYTCYAVATAAVAADARIALYDVDPVTLAPDLDDLERSAANGARAVVVTPLFGIPLDWEAIERRLAPHGGVAIEDAAQGHGAAWRGRPLGAHGRISVLSFGRGKGWTGAGGGALLLRDGLGGADVPLHQGSGAGEARVIAAALAQWALARPGLYGVPASLPWLRLGQTVYREPSVPAPLTRGAAALLEAGRRGAEAEAAARRENGAFFSDRLSAGGATRPVRAEPGGTAGFLRFPVLLRHGWASLPDAARAVRLGMSPGYPTTLAALAPVRERMGDGRARWPGAELLARRLVTLPTHSRISPADRAEIFETLAGAGAR